LPQTGGVRVVTIADRRSATDTQIGDTQGQLGYFKATHGLREMLVRPDFNLFGGATDGSRLTALIEDFAQQMHRYGLKSARTAAID
jgi:hypothetical protein